MKKIKVLWLAPLPYPENLQVHPAPWISSLSKILIESNEVDLTILSVKKGDAKSFISSGIQYHFLSSVREKFNILSLYYLNQFVLYKWMRRNGEGFDIIHIHGTEHQLDFRVLESKTPVVLSIQGSLIEYSKHLNPWKWRWITFKIKGLFEYRAFRRLRHFMGRTRWDKEIIEKYSPLSKYYYAPESIRREFFNSQYSFQGKGIAFVGGMNEFKGLSLLLDALLGLKFIGNIDVHIIGGNRQEVIRFCNERMAGDHRFNFVAHGMCNASQMLSIFELSRVLVHPSVIDNSPNSICEAQVFGLPVIACDVGGVNSLIQHSETGLLIKRNVTSLVDSMHKIFEEDELWKSISEKSKKISRERHNPELIKKTYLDIYNSIIMSYNTPEVSSQLWQDR